MIDVVDCDMIVVSVSIVFYNMDMYAMNVLLMFPVQTIEPNMFDERDENMEAESQDKMKSNQINR